MAIYPLPLNVVPSRWDDNTTVIYPVADRHVAIGDTKKLLLDGPAGGNYFKSLSATEVGLYLNDSAYPEFYFEDDKFASTTGIYVSGVADGGTAFTHNAGNAFTSGKLDSWQNNEVEKAYIDFAGDFWSATGVFESGVAPSVGGTPFFTELTGVPLSGQITYELKDTTSRLYVRERLFNYGANDWGLRLNLNRGGAGTYSFYEIQPEDDTGIYNFGFYPSNGFGNQRGLCTSGVADGGVAHTFRTAAAYTSGKLFSFGDTGEKAYVDYVGTIHSKGAVRNLVSKVFGDSPYAAAADDYTIAVDATGGITQVDLPASAGVTGRIFVIKKTDASVNKVIVDANLVETIDGALTVDLNNQWDSVTIQSDGTNWLII